MLESLHTTIPGEVMLPDTLLNDLEKILHKHHFSHAVLIIPMPDNTLQIALSNVTPDQLQRMSGEVARVMKMERSHLN